MTDQELRMQCMHWAYWCFTRKYFAPPVPANILAQMQPRTRAPKEPDGPMDPDMPFFNMAVHGLADEDPESAICFSLYYFHGIRPVKVMADKLGIGTRTFYDRMHRFAARAQRLSGSIKRVHLAQTVVEKRAPAEVD